LKLESQKSIKTRNSFPVGRDGMSGGGRASGGVQAKPRLWWSAADGSEPTPPAKSVRHVGTLGM